VFRGNGQTGRPAWRLLHRPANEEAWMRLMGTTAKQAMWWLAMVLAAGASGCTGGTSTTGSSLTNGGEGEGECTPDPAPIDPACVLCEPNANAPAISGRLIVEGTEPAPTAAGGDPTGVWVGRAVTVNIPAAAGDMVDVAASGFQGSGWIAFNADGTFEFLIDGEATVRLTGADTPIVKGASGGAKGTWSVAGTTLSFAPECQFTDDPEAIGEAGGIRLDSNPFSVSGSTMTLQAQMQVSGISVGVILVLDAAG
jgi:hypothetical protein